MKYLQAETESRIALEILRSSSPNHQYTASAEYLLSIALVGQFKSLEAESTLRQNISRWSRAEAPPWRAARSESILGIAQLQLHKPVEAKQHLLHANEVLSAKDSGAFPDEIIASRKRVEEFKRCEAAHRLDTCEIPI
jgi:hypothetical protein